jgi:hypothetical protein
MRIPGGSSHRCPGFGRRCGSTLSSHPEAILSCPGRGWIAFTGLLSRDTASMAWRGLRLLRLSFLTRFWLIVFGRTQLRLVRQIGGAERLG